MRDMLSDYYFLQGLRRGIVLACLVGVVVSGLLALARPGEWRFEAALCVVFVGNGAFIWLYGLVKGFGKW